MMSTSKWNLLLLQSVRLSTGSLCSTGGGAEVKGSPVLLTFGRRSLNDTPSQTVPGGCNFKYVLAKVIDVCPEEGGSMSCRNDGTSLSAVSLCVLSQKTAIWIRTFVVKFYVWY